MLLAACNQSQMIASNKAIVQEDKYHTVSFTLSTPKQVRVYLILEQGPNVDIYLANKANATKWIAIVSGSQVSDGTIGHYPDLGVEGLAHEFASSSRLLPAGEYTLIIDNTKNGASQPPPNVKDNTATVTYEIHTK
jgi:hypothetical protein